MLPRPVPLIARQPQPKLAPGRTAEGASGHVAAPAAAPKPKAKK